jgi:hypothetical protein
MISDKEKIFQKNLSISLAPKIARYEISALRRCHWIFPTMLHHCSIVPRRCHLSILRLWSLNYALTMNPVIISYEMVSDCTVPEFLHGRK